MRDYAHLIRHPGVENLFRALEMAVLSTYVGKPLHLHAQGLRGTGKTTIMRSVRSILPRILRIKGCIYNCHPRAPHCPAHRDLPVEAILELGQEEIVMPFLEISASAKIGTVVGTIDLERLTAAEGAKAVLLPGTIPLAHRGIILVDEINRLADIAPELADVLLDVMGTKPGRIQVEETGLPRVEMSVSVSVWAASNPDEDPGPLEEIRRQLSDRFDLSITVSRPGRQDVVKRILFGPSRSAVPQAAPDFAALAGLVPRVKVPEQIKDLVASIYVDFSLESLRGVEAMVQAARLSAALDGRTEVAREDVLMVAPLALEHRVDPATLGRITNRIRTSGENSGEVAGQRPTGVTANPERTPEREEQRGGLIRRLGATLRSMASGLSGNGGDGPRAPEQGDGEADQPGEAPHGRQDDLNSRRTGVRQDCPPGPGAGDPEVRAPLRPGREILSLDPEDWVKG